MLFWNHLLPDKLGILDENVEAPENYADIKSAYATFLRRCNMMDLIDVYQKCGALALENEPLSPVSFAIGYCTKEASACHFILASKSGSGQLNKTETELAT